MISYAQNREDVVLARVLPRPDGFYVDVGAADPLIASVTKYFYDLGWHGINLEPRPAALAKLRLERPRDVNLGVAAGAGNGTSSFFIVEEDPDLSTIDELDRDLLVDKGYSASLHSVDVRTLDDILSEYGVGDIDFIKIDVEGSEAAVLEGLDLSKWRPRVVVVEAVEPYSYVRTDHLWRHLLEQAGYREGCFDGINLFFARGDDSAVLDKLVPASPIDDFQTAHVAGMERYIRELESALGYDRDESDARPGPSPRRRSRGDARSDLRLAILATPCTGAPWLARALGGAIEAPSLSLDHPADVPWDSLPSRVVLEVPATRTRLLQERLAELNFVVVSISRHPAETLLSIANLSGVGSPETAGPGLDEDRFLEWATSRAAHRLLRITPSWWVIPSTVQVRFEALVRGYDEVCSTILDECGWQGPRLPTSAPSNEPEMDLNQHQPGAVAEMLRSGDGSQRIYEALRDVFDTLDYGAQATH